MKVIWCPFRQNIGQKIRCSLQAGQRLVASFCKRAKQIVSWYLQLLTSTLSSTMIDFARQRSRCGQRDLSEPLPELLAFVSNASMEIKHLINVEVNIEESTTAGYFQAQPSTASTNFLSTGSSLSRHDREVLLPPTKRFPKKVLRRSRKRRMTTAPNNAPCLSHIRLPSTGTLLKGSIAGPIYGKNYLSVQASPNLLLQHKRHSLVSIQHGSCKESFYQNVKEPRKNNEIDLHVEKSVTRNVQEQEKNINPGYLVATTPCPDLEDLLGFMMAEDLMNPDIFMSSLMGL